MSRAGSQRLPATPRGLAQTARRERILHAAAELARTEDFEDLQMQDVAQAAGVALGTLYRYFPSKTQLMLAVIDEQLVGAGHAVPAGQEPGEAVLELMLRCFDLIAQRPSLATVALHAAPESLDSAMAEAVLRVLGDVRGRRLVSVRLLMYTWWGVVVSTRRGHLDQAEGHEHIRLSVDLLLTTDDRYEGDTYAARR